MDNQLPLGYHFTTTINQQQETEGTVPTRTACILEQIGLTCNPGDKIQLPDAIVRLLDN